MSDTEFASYPSLAGLPVLITGGGTGIGASLVEHFCQQSSRVAFVDIAEEESEKLVADMEAKGYPRPLFARCDLRDIEALRVVITQFGEELGPIRVLVNNAANDDRHEIEDVTPDYWRDRFSVNLDHQFFAAQAVRPQMKEAGGGSIINMGSIVWKIGYGGLPGYSTAKAAVSGMTRGMARDFGPDNIRVNTVLPGAILTERQLKLWFDDAFKELVMDRQCLQEFLYPPDVARMVLFLASDDGRLITSQEFIVDGGWV
ncbi:MAG: SDR family oxidoreductase [Rhodospirillales bacterium]|nr:SDR family oxidoreductase [Rhodospirillales bacterium]